MFNASPFLSDAELPDLRNAGSKDKAFIFTFDDFQQCEVSPAWLRYELPKLGIAGSNARPSPGATMPGALSLHRQPQLALIFTSRGQIILQAIIKSA